MRNAVGVRKGLVFAVANIKAAIELASNRRPPLPLPPSRLREIDTYVDFPDAVGPTMATRGRSVLFLLIERGGAAPEQEKNKQRKWRGEDCLEPVGAGVSLISGFDRQIIHRK